MLQIKDKLIQKSIPESVKQKLIDEIVEEYSIKSDNRFEPHTQKVCMYVTWFDHILQILILIRCVVYVTSFEYSLCKAMKVNGKALFSRKKLVK